jgi:hypothetical protein
MKTFLVFLLFLVVFIAIIALALKYFKWLLKLRQEEKKPNSIDGTSHKKKS